MHFYSAFSTWTRNLRLLVIGLGSDSFSRTGFAIAQTRLYILVYNFIRFVLEQLLILLLQLFSKFLWMKLGVLLRWFPVENFKLWLEICLNYLTVIAF